MSVEEYVDMVVVIGGISLDISLDTSEVCTVSLEMSEVTGTSLDTSEVSGTSLDISEVNGTSEVEDSTMEEGAGGGVTT